MIQRISKHCIESSKYQTYGKIMQQLLEYSSMYNNNTVIIDFNDINF